MRVGGSDGRLSESIIKAWNALDRSRGTFSHLFVLVPEVKSGDNEKNNIQKLTGQRRPPAYRSFS
jgi:hypothetical protein